MGQYGYDQLPNASSDGAQPSNLNGYSFGDQASYGGLYVECITAQSIYGIHVQGIAFTNVIEQRAESLPLRGEYGPRHTFVNELFVDPVALREGRSLRCNALI